MSGEFDFDKYRADNEAIDRFLTRFGLSPVKEAELYRHILERVAEAIRRMEAASERADTATQYNDTMDDLPPDPEPASFHPLYPERWGQP
jgi:hypothetical protein